MVVTEQATESLVTFNLADGLADFAARQNQFVAESLMVALGVIACGWTSIRAAGHERFSLESSFPGGAEISKSLVRSAIWPGIPG